MDDERGASVAEQRMAVAAKRDVFIFNLEMGFAVGADREVGIVSGVMAFGILQAMFLSIGIKMRPGGLEVGGVALCVLMKVDGMFAGWQILKIQFHPDTCAGFQKSRGAHRLALGILELDLDLSFGLTGRCQCDHEHCEGEQASDFHGCIIAKAVSPLQVLEISCELRVTSYGQPGSLEARG